MKKRLCTIMAMCMLVSAFSVGCGNSNAQSSGNVADTASAATEKTENMGTELEVSGTETRQEAEEVIFTDKVVASSVAVVEILDALGIPMVGVPTSTYGLPESVADATRIGNPMSPDIEVIASLEPTVVVSVDSLSADLTEQFKVLGAEVFFVNLSGYEGLKETITNLGTRFGTAEKAAELIADFDAREQAVLAEIEGKEAPSVLIIFGAGSSFMTASADTYVGDLVKRVGGENIITDAPSAFAPVDMEYLASMNPEYILFMSHANPEESLKAFKQEVANNEAWQNFDAVKNDKLIALETGYFGMSANLLTVDAMEMLADILYEEN